MGWNNGPKTKTDEVLPSVGHDYRDDSVTLGGFSFSPERARWYGEMLIYYGWLAHHRAQARRMGEASHPEMYEDE